MDQGKILVTEDEESLRFVLQKALEDEGYWVQTAANGATARRLLNETRFDVSLMDIKLPDADGLTLLKEFKDSGIDTAMILMTAQNTMRNAIGAMKNGAFDYITKPFDLDEVLVLVKRAMDSRKLTRDFRELKEEVKKRFEPGVNIIGTSSTMQKVYKTIGQVVDTQRDDPDSRRERHRQRAGRQDHSLQFAALEPAVHRHQLRRHPARPFGKRAVRPRKRRLYRRPRSPHRQVRARRRRHAISRRSRRHSRSSSRPNCCACSRITSTAASAAATF